MELQGLIPSRDLKSRLYTREMMDKLLSNLEVLPSMISLNEFFATYNNLDNVFALE